MSSGPSSTWVQYGASSGTASLKQDSKSRRTSGDAFSFSVSDADVCRHEQVQRGRPAARRAPAARRRPRGHEVEAAPGAGAARSPAGSTSGSRATSPASSSGNAVESADWAASTAVSSRRSSAFADPDVARFRHRLQLGGDRLGARRAELPARALQRVGGARHRRRIALAQRLGDLLEGRGWRPRGTVRPGSSSARSRARPRSPW